MKHFIEAFTNTFNFTGRSTKKQYFSFVLFWIIGLILATTIVFLLNDGMTIILFLYLLLTLLPFVAITIRRLRDSDKNPLLVLVGLVPFIGGFILLALASGPTINRMPEGQFLEKAKEDAVIKNIAGERFAPIFNANKFAIEREDSITQANRNFDVYDENSNLILKCSERPVEGLSKVLRYTKFSKSTESVIDICDLNNEPLFYVAKSPGRVSAMLEVYDKFGAQIGSLDAAAKVTKKFAAFNMDKTELFEVSNPITATNSYSFDAPDKMVLANIREKNFEKVTGESSASSTFYLNINDKIPQDSDLRLIIFAAALFCDLT